MRTNPKVENLYRKENIVQFIDNIRIQWAGHA